MITRHFTLHLNAGCAAPLVINVSQNDREIWVFTLIDSNGVQYRPSSGAIIGLKSDKLGILKNGTVDSDGNVVITNDNGQITAAAGKNIFELLIDDQTHGTANFIVLVEPRPGEGADFSESDLSLLQQAIDGTSATAIAQGVSDWMDDNLTPTTPVVDQSLTVQGAAADAKKTGDEISDLKSQIAQGGGGLTADVKSALMNVVNHIGAWTDGNAQTYISALQNALYPPTNLTRITAVYTQGSTIVYDTDSLNSLKANLVVTAYYDNGTSEAITNYTLSGTLTVGTSTITASYGGKTATFNVSVTAEPFPSSIYQQVEWVGATITSAANRESYIDVGIHVAEKIGMSGYDITYSALSEGAYFTDAGAPAPLLAWSSNTACYFGAINTDATNKAYGFSRSAILDASAISVGTKQDFHTYWNNTSGITECGQYSCTLDYIQGSADLNLKFGTGMWASSGGSFKFYGDIQVKKDGTLVRDLFPCYRKADGVIGFYDTVGKTFYTKQGSGAAFAKGSDI